MSVGHEEFISPATFHSSCFYKWRVRAGDIDVALCFRLATEGTERVIIVFEAFERSFRKVDRICHSVKEVLRPSYLLTGCGPSD